MIIVYFDGACEPINPKGIATYGYVVYRDNQKIAEGSGLACEPFSWNSSNNVAEYTALVKALEYLVENGLTDKQVVVRGDSQLVIRQMIGWYSVKSERIKPLYEKAVELASKFKEIEFEWIPREYNEEADNLSHKAYVKFLDSHPDAVKKIEKYLATEKQIKYLELLGVKVYKYMGKFEASRLISRALQKKQKKKNQNSA